MVWKPRPFYLVLSLGNEKKSGGARSGECGGWGTIGVCRFAEWLAQEATREPAHCHDETSKPGFTTIQASYCAKNLAITLEFPGRLLCLPSDHVAQIPDGQCLCNKKHTTNITFIFDRLKHAFFEWGEPLPTHCDDCTTVSTPSHKPMFIACYDVLRKVFVNGSGEQSLANFSMGLFLIVSQQTWHEFGTDTTPSQVCHSKFHGMILC